MLVLFPYLEMRDVGFLESSVFLRSLREQRGDNLLLDRSTRALGGHTWKIYEEAGKVKLSLATESEELLGFWGEWVRGR